MAYGIKYRHSYCNEYGVSSTVTILENGYSGSIKEIDAQEDPIVISQEGSDTDKFDTIRPSAASIGLIGSDDFKLEELFTADERKYMVENHVGGVMVWRGFVIPNGFSHEWTGGTFPMEIIASDNLSTLKDFPFLNDNGTVISGRMRHTDILLKCLNKLDINIDLLTLTGLNRPDAVAWEDPVFVNDTDTYTFLDTNVKEEGVDFYFDNPENAWTCEDVVKNICSIYGAKLYQSKGYWRFKRINVDYGVDISGQTFNRYNQSGVKVGDIPYDEQITIPCSDYLGNKVQFDGAILAMSEVYKSAQSRYNYRYKVAGDNLSPIIKNQELEYPFPTPPPATFVPLNWTVEMVAFVEPPATRTINIAPELKPSGDFPPNTTGGAIRLYGGNRKGGDSLRSLPSQTINIKKGDRFSFNFWHKTPVGFYQGEYYRFYCLVRIIFNKENSVRKWVLKNQDFVKANPSSSYTRIHKPSWVEIETGANPAMSFIAGETTMEWINEQLISQSVPDDGTITIEFAGVGFPEDSQVRPPDETSIAIHAYLPTRPTTIIEDYQVTYVQKHARVVNTEFKIGEMHSGVLKGQGNSSGRIYTSEQNAKFTNRGNQVGLATADVLDSNLIGDIRTGGVFENRWNDTRNPYPERMPLGMLLTQDVMRQYKNVWRVIQEDIKAQGLSFDTTIVFEERPNERYLIQRGSISQKFNRLISATLIQVSESPITAFVGTKTTEEDYKTTNRGSGSGSTGGGSGSGSGSAPQDLQSVTDIGAETTNIITAKGVRAESLLEIPDEEPALEDRRPDKTYIYRNEEGHSAQPSPELGNLEDLQNVADVIPNGLFLFKGSDGIWKGVDNPIPDLSEYALKSWVEVGFAAKDDIRILHGEEAYGWGDYRDFGLGSVSVDIPDLNDANRLDRGGEFMRATTGGNTPFAGLGVGLNIAYSSTRNAQIWFNLGTSTVQIRTASSTGWNPIYNLWGSMNRRSDSEDDDRFLLRTTDTFTGNLTVTGTVDANLTHSRGYFIIRPYGASYDDGSYFRAYWDGIGDSIRINKIGGVSGTPTFRGANIVAPLVRATQALGIPNGAPPVALRETGVTYLFRQN